MGVLACKGQPTIKDGSAVKMHYTLTVDGQTVDTSRPAEPLSFTFGSGQIIAGLEEQLRGLSAGAKKAVVVPPEKGYGPVIPQAIQKVPRKNFQNSADLKPGVTVSAQQEGRFIQAKVVEVSKDAITLDLNHPMAGKTLNFDIEVLEVADGAPAKAEQKGS